jgi:hypothetical protein
VWLAANLVPRRPACLHTTRAGVATVLSRCGLIVGGVVLLCSCYVYRPLQGSPPSGMHVALDLNDRGRVALSDSIGPSADRIEGEVQSAGDSGFVLRVTSVRYTNGQRHKWTNEPLGVRTDLVRDLQERQFSRTRTVIVAGISTAALVAFVISRDLLGFGAEGGEGGGPGPDQ